MPFDDSYNSYESFKLAHKKPVLVVHKNYIIAREGGSQAKYARLMMYFGLAIMFIVLFSWNTLIEPMTLNG